MAPSISKPSIILEMKLSNYWVEQVSMFYLVPIYAVCTLAQFRVGLTGVARDLFSQKFSSEPCQSVLHKYVNTRAGGASIKATRSKQQTLETGEMRTTTRPSSVRSPCQSPVRSGAVGSPTYLVSARQLTFRPRVQPAAAGRRRLPPAPSP